MGAPPPHTPQHVQREQAYRFIIDTVDKLNDTYGTNIRCDCTSRSSAQRKSMARTNETYGRHQRIFDTVRFLHFQKGDYLNDALGDFFFEAKVASSKWVPKPGADVDMLPTSMRPPRATSEAGALQLEMLLGEVLERHKKHAMPRRPFSPALSALATTPSSTQAFARPPSTQAFSRPSSTQAFYLSPAFSPVATFSPSALPDQTPQWANTGARSKRQSKEDSESEDGPSSQKRRRSGGRDCPGQAASVIDCVPSRNRLSTRSLDPATNNFSTQPAGFAASPFVRCAPEPNAEISFRNVNKGKTVSEARTRTSFTIANPDGSSFNRTDSGTFKTLAHWGDAATTAAARGPGGPDPPASSYDQRPPVSACLRSLDTTTAFGYGATLNTTESPQPRRPATAAPRLGNGPACKAYARPPLLKDRLSTVWPKCPKWLRDAPLAFRWEITRVSLYCKVPLEDETCFYNRTWSSAEDMWRGLRTHDAFRGKTFPERPTKDAFAAALGSFAKASNAVLLAVSLDFPKQATSGGAPFLLTMRPIQFDQSCRLMRHFGARRFLQVLLPSPTSPACEKKMSGPDAAARIVEWLNVPHSFVGLQWRAFYTCDAGYRKPAKELSLGEEKPVFKERVHLFAEEAGSTVPDMLRWLLSVMNSPNQKQPYLKLFSRIQLGLSKTWPVLTFEPDQIYHQERDLLSPTGNVMNDGIGRMSRSVARKVRDALGLLDIPCAVQGRIGSAKGMWLMDVHDVGDRDWIETYPSQRKWICDHTDDPDQRTLEIRNTPFEVKSAHLNLQFLPVLEDRAKDRGLMRAMIGKKIEDSLERQFESQKEALKTPIQFRQWIAENFSARNDRVNFGAVPFVGGLPKSSTEEAFFMLNAGFDPLTHQRLWDINWNMQVDLTKTLKTKLNVRVGRSAYMYMVIDFWGLLEEDEIHVSFSNRFRDEDYSATLLDKQDVLVARSPAHFISDVQKVRAVFKSELVALHDVVVFPAKGNVALADKLSGGDYDGDMAWVCWDPDIVDQFVNAPVPRQPDLSRYLAKEKTTFADLVYRNQSPDQAVYDMICKSFSFAMQPNFLGICTNFKEKLCYQRNSVSDKQAVVLSTLVSNLVDQSKQGIIFTNESWKNLRRDKLGGANPPDPDYKKDRVSYGDGCVIPHIIDHLKFRVAIPAIERELTTLHQANRDKDKSWYADPDLTCQYEAFEELAKKSRTCKLLLEQLKKDINRAGFEWNRGMNRFREGKLGWLDMVKGVYEIWSDIQPLPPSKCRQDSGTASQTTSAQTSFSSLGNTIFSGRNSTVASANTSFDSIRGSQAMTTAPQPSLARAEVDSKTVSLLLQGYLGDPELSEWANLRASTAFATVRNKSFVWNMAGRQLAALKAKRVGAPVVVTGLMYAGMVPDRKFTKQYVARNEGQGSEYPEEGGWAKEADDDWDAVDVDVQEREMLMIEE